MIVGGKTIISLVLPSSQTRPKGRHRAYQPSTRRPNDINAGTGRHMKSSDSTADAFYVFPLCCGRRLSSITSMFYHTCCGFTDARPDKIRQHIATCPFSLCWQFVVNCVFPFWYNKYCICNFLRCGTWYSCLQKAPSSYLSINRWVLYNQKADEITYQTISLQLMRPCPLMYWDSHLCWLFA